MSSSLTSIRWQEFLETLSQTLDINIGVVDSSGKVLVSFFRRLDIDKKNYSQLVSVYKKFFINVVKNVDSSPKVLFDPLGLLISIVPLADSNYLILGGVQEKKQGVSIEQVEKNLAKYKINKNLNNIKDNFVLLSRNGLILKAENAKKLYDQLLYMTKERDELGQKMMLLTAIEEYDKLLLSIIRPEQFNLKPLLELINSSLIIIFDAESSWVFSYCIDQCFTAFRGNHKKLLSKLSEKWVNIVSDNKSYIEKKGSWLKAEEAKLLEYDSKTITIESEEFIATIGLVKASNSYSNLTDALNIFSRMVTIGLEMQSFFNTLNYRLGYLLKYMRQGIIIFNTQGKVIAYNQTALNIYNAQGINLTPGSSHNNYCFDKAINRAIDSVIKEGLEHLQQQSVIENKANKYYLKWDAVPLKDENDKIKGTILVLEDITEVIKLKHQIHEQERKAIAGNLAAGFAHEIRNPLSVAGGAIQLLEIIDNPDRQKKLLHKLRGELNRINQILTDFMDIAKPYKKKEFMLINIPTVLEEINFLIKSDANLNNVQLKIEEDTGNIPLIKGDKIYLKQVFLNVMKIAIEAMEDGGRLEIAYCHDSTSVSILFKDNGPGIPKEHLPLILRSFFTTKVEGTGLGLAISSELIKNMGGEIKIESELGEGTTVRIILPVHKAEQK